jgi:hypothetical protein
VDHGHERRDDRALLRHLIEGAGDDIARRLGAFEADHEGDAGMLSVPGT